MIAAELVSEIIPPLKTSDSGIKALKWMNEFNVSHLPIVNNRQFLGLITEEDILDLNEPEEALGNHRLSLFRPFIYEYQHIYEVMRLASELKLSIIPVIDSEDNYAGIIPMENIINYFSKLTSITEPGGILVLEVFQKDYSLAEIARLVESNDAKVLSFYMTPASDPAKFEITLKINKTDLKHVIATFERFSYEVKATYLESEYTENLKDRFDSLMNYLNV